MSENTELNVWKELVYLRQENAVLKALVAKMGSDRASVRETQEPHVYSLPADVNTGVTNPSALQDTDVPSLPDALIALSEVPAVAHTSVAGEQTTLEAWLSRMLIEEPALFATYLRDLAEYKQTEGALHSLMTGAQCLLWYANVSESEEGILYFYPHLPYEEGAQRFFPVEVPSGGSYFDSWYWTRLEEDRLRSDTHGRAAIREGKSYRQEFRCRRADGDIRWLAEYVSVEALGAKQWKLVGVCTDITELKRAEEALLLSEERFRSLIEDGSDVLMIIDSGWTIRYHSSSSERILGYKPEAMQAQCVLTYVHPDDIEKFVVALQSQWDRPGMASGSLEIRVQHRDDAWHFVEVTIRNMRDRPSIAGIVLTMRDVEERKSAQQLIQLQFERLTALRAIETVIATSLDLRLTLHFFLDQVVTLLHVDAADVLLFNEQNHMLEYTAGWGFRNTNLARRSLRLGEGQAGIAALERRTLCFDDLRISNPSLLHGALFEREGFIAYVAVPLLAKGMVVGVMELYHRSPLQLTDASRDFAETLAGQAAIAIDNATLFESFQSTNAELTMAYDATIEGWSRALDLRDKETEGHSERVTEMTLRLARSLGVDDNTLRYMRYGALLHDIGKMGIPDSILLKPDVLTEDEWEIMRWHPTYAYDMLEPIAFLRPALDIPYCHHERWDGAGYPRGLAGEEIPLAARIFAIVDVWDALRSDRPYRKGWSEERVREHIRIQAGTHLDPALVEVFLSMDW